MSELAGDLAAERARRAAPVRALFVLPDPGLPHFTRAERRALRRRKEATITGRCACGATRAPLDTRPGAVAHTTIEHEASCPAADEELLERACRRALRQGATLMRLYAAEIGPDGRGREISSEPAP